MHFLARIGSEAIIKVVFKQVVLAFVFHVTFHDALEAEMLFSLVLFSFSQWFWVLISKHSMLSGI